MGQMVTEPGNEQKDRCADGHQRTQGITEGQRRRDAQNHVPQDAAAGGGDNTQNNNAQQIHVLFYGSQRPRGRKGNGTDEFKDGDE